MIVEGLEFVLYTLKCALYPDPELVSSGWSHTGATIFMTLLYFTYFLVFVALHLAHQEWMIKEKEQNDN